MHVRWLLVLYAVVRAASGQNCRAGEQPKNRDCNVCNGEICKIRAALLLPRNTTYDACLSAVEPVRDLAMLDQAVQEAIPPGIEIEWLTYDVKDCDAAYAVISAIDAYNDCAHVFFGPACDFALASVARITKFLGSTGMPIITTGGFTFDFVKPKKACTDEFYMLVRAGPTGFEDLAHFVIDLMRQFEWNRVQIIYDTPAYEPTVGADGGFLLAATLNNYMLRAGVDISAWELLSLSQQSYEDMLRMTVGNNFASESVVAIFRVLWHS